MSAFETIASSDDPSREDIHGAQPSSTSPGLETLSWTSLLDRIRHCHGPLREPADEDGQPLAQLQQALYLEQALRDLNSIESHRQRLLALQNAEAVEMLDILQTWLDKSTVESTFRRAGLHLLVKLSARSGQLPQSIFLSPGAVDVDLSHRCAGGFADVYQGSFRGEQVAIKQPRVFGDIAQAHIKLCREALVWRYIRHPYILPLIGVGGEGTVLETRGPCLVSPWMKMGTLLEYTNSADYDHKKDLYRLIHELAQGILYLHAQNIVHGDIKDTNVLIDDHGHAQIADLGLVLVEDATRDHMTTTRNNVGTVRYMSPQRLQSDDHRREAADDVYAFGCLCYALFQGRVPFQDENTFLAATKISQGQRPPRPGVDGTSQDTKDRPSMIHVLICIEALFEADHCLVAVDALESHEDSGALMEALLDTSVAVFRQVARNRHENLRLLLCTAIDLSVALQHNPYARSQCVPRDNTRVFVVPDILAQIMLLFDVQLFKDHINLSALHSNMVTRSPLHFAVHCESAAMVELLIAHGADIYTTNDLGWTPMHHACAMGLASIVRILLDFDKQHIYSADAFGNSLLHLASLGRKYDVLQLLCESNYRRDIDAVNMLDETAIHIVARDGYAGAFTMLLRSDATLTHLSHWRRSALHEACSVGLLETLPVPLYLPCIVHFSDRYGFTPLQVACDLGLRELVDYFMRSGGSATLSTCGPRGLMPLHAAAIRDDGAITELLLDHHASFHAGDNGGRTPLHWACIVDSIDVANSILRRFDMQRDAALRNGLPSESVRSPIQAIDTFGWTPLHWAAYRGCPSMLQLLLFRRANPMVRSRNKAQWTPLHCAVAGLLTTSQYGDSPLAGYSTWCEIRDDIPQKNTSNCYYLCGCILLENQRSGPDLTLLMDAKARTPLQMFQRILKTIYKGATEQIWRDRGAELFYESLRGQNLHRTKLITSPEAQESTSTCPSHVFTPSTVSQSSSSSNPGQGHHRLSFITTSMEKVKRRLISTQTPK